MASRLRFLKNPVFRARVETGGNTVSWSGGRRAGQAAGTRDRPPGDSWVGFATGSLYFSSRWEFSVMTVVTLILFIIGITFQREIAGRPSRVTGLRENAGLVPRRWDSGTPAACPKAEAHSEDERGEAGKVRCSGPETEPALITGQLQGQSVNCAGTQERDTDQGAQTDRDRRRPSLAHSRPHPLALG